MCQVVEPEAQTASWGPGEVPCGGECCCWTLGSPLNSNVPLRLLVGGGVGEEGSSAVWHSVWPGSVPEQPASQSASQQASQPASQPASASLPPLRPKTKLGRRQTLHALCLSLHRFPLLSCALSLPSSPSFGAIVLNPISSKVITLPRFISRQHILTVCPAQLCRLFHCSSSIQSY